MNTAHNDDDTKNINDILNIVKKHTGDSVDTNNALSVVFSYNPNKLLSKAYVIQHISKGLRRKVPMLVKESALSESDFDKYGMVHFWVSWKDVIGAEEDERVTQKLEKKLTKMKISYFNIVSEIFTTDPYFKKIRESLSEDEYLDFYINIKGYNFKSFLMTLNPAKLHKHIKGFVTRRLPSPGFRFYVGKNDIKDEGRKIVTYLR